MKQAYGLPDDESILIMIDKKGIIRYIYPGKVPEKYFTGIKDLIGKLCLE
jgi:predicted transcriptional regulator